MPFDISVVVLFHAEGSIAHRTLKALSRSVSFVQSNGLNVEVIGVLDRVQDNVTLEVVKDWRSKLDKIFSIHEVDFGALSSSRNFGISKSKGEFVSILDGDDLYSEEWLYRAFQTCSSNPNRIAHPEFLFLFPIESYLKSYRRGKEVLLSLLLGNQWSALTFAHRKIFEEIPYVVDNEVYAFQDWLWNCQTAVAGYEHILVPETLMAVRQSPPGKSLWQGSFRKNKVIRPNELFRRIFMRKLPSFFEGDDHLNDDGKQISRIFRSAATLITPIMDNLYEEKPLLHKTIIDVKRNLVHAFRLLRNPEAVPPWVLREIRDLSRIEPTLEYTSKIRTRIQAYFPVADMITQEMSKLVEDPSAPVFILDRLEAGDALNKALFYMYVVDRPIYVLTTERSNRQQPDLLPSGSIHIDIGNASLVYEDRIKFMHRLLLESRPAFIHIIRSAPAFEMLSRYGATFKGTKIMATIFSPDDAYESDFIGWELRRYPELVDNLSCIATDTSFFRKRVLDVFGNANSPIVHHPLPFNLSPSSEPHNSGYHSKKLEKLSEPDGQRVRVLLAGQKKFGQLRRWHSGVSKSIPRNIHPSFHLIDTVQMTNSVSRENFSSVSPQDPKMDTVGDLSSFHMLILLSKASEAFSLLLQAMGNGIPVVARKSALTEELVGKERGWLVEGNRRPDDLIPVASECMKNLTIQKQKGIAASHFIRNEHSLENFNKLAREFYDL